MMTRARTTGLATARLCSRQCASSVEPATQQQPFHYQAFDHSTIQSTEGLRNGLRDLLPPRICLGLLNKRHVFRGFAAGQQHQQQRACGSCGAPLGQQKATFSCPACHALQPIPEGEDYSPFEVFSEELCFDVDLAKLDRKFKDLQRILHPDKFAGASAEDQKVAAELSSLVNASYRVLQGPLPRARLLLRIQGSQTEKDDEKTIQDPELLMEMMEAREEVDAAADEASLQGLLARNASSTEECVQELSAAFRAADSGAAIKLTQRLTYLTKIEEEIKRKL